MRSILISLLLAVSTGLFAQEIPQKLGIVDVTGVAEVTLKADRVSIQIFIEEERKDPMEAQAAASEEVKQILAVLKAEKSVCELNSVDVQLRPRQDYQKQEKSYIARHTISFELDSVATYESLMPKILKMGVDGIGRVEFRSSEQEKFEAMLLKKALLNARQKAELLAGELGQNVGKATYISDRVNRISPSPVSAYSDAVSISSGSIEPGNVTIRVMVTAHFELQ